MPAYISLTCRVLNHEVHSAYYVELGCHMMMIDVISALVNNFTVVVVHV